MLKKSLKLISMLSILLLFTGCWDSLDVHNKNILTTVLLDYKDNNIFIYTEVANILGEAKQNEQGIKAKYNICVSQGKTIVEAKDQLVRKTSQPTFNGAIRILIITNRCSELKGIEEYANRVRGLDDYRKSISIITTPDEPEAFFKIEPENSASIGFAIEGTLKSLLNSGENFEFTSGNVLETMAVKKVGYLLPEYKIVDQQHMFYGYSVFKENKRIGAISENDRKGIVFLLNPKAKFVYEVNYDSCSYVIEVENKDKKIQTNYENNQLCYDINMKFDAYIDYSERMVFITNEDRAGITKELEKLLKQNIADAIDTSQHKYNCDYLEFYKYFRAKYQKDFKSMEDWAEVYSNAQMNLTVEANILVNKNPQKTES